MAFIFTQDSINKINTYKNIYKPYPLQQKDEIYTYISSIKDNKANIEFFNTLIEYKPILKPISSILVKNIVIIEIKESLVTLFKKELKSDQLTSRDQDFINDYIKSFYCLERDFNCGHKSAQHAIKSKKNIDKSIGLEKLTEWLSNIHKNYQTLYSTCEEELIKQSKDSHKYSDQTVQCFVNAAKTSVSEYKLNGLTTWEIVFGVNTNKYLPSFQNKISECYGMIDQESEYTV